MAGEHILKLLIEENASIKMGSKQMCCKFTPSEPGGIEFIVYESKPYARRGKIIFIADNEKDACKILKGE